MKIQVRTNKLGWTNFHSDAKNGKVFTSLKILALATNEGYTVAHAQAFHGSPVPKECLSWATAREYLGGGAGVTVRTMAKMSS